MLHDSTLTLIVNKCNIFCECFEASIIITVTCIAAGCFEIKLFAVTENNFKYYKVTLFPVTCNNFNWSKAQLFNITLLDTIRFW